jgi:hypothetical protein
MLLGFGIVYTILVFRGGPTSCLRNTDSPFLCTGASGTVTPAETVAGRRQTLIIGCPNSRVINTVTDAPAASCGERAGAP